MSLTCFWIWNFHQMTYKERFSNLLEGFRECASLSLPGTGQRGGRRIQGCLNDHHLLHFQPQSCCGTPLSYKKMRVNAHTLPLASLVCSSPATPSCSFIRHDDVVNIVEYPIAATTRLTVERRTHRQTC